MEFTLKHTYIFDANIRMVFDKLIKKNIGKFNKDIPYKAVISFDVNLINDVKLEDLKNTILSESKRPIEQKDIIYEAMSRQLDTFRDVLKENGIDSYFTDINGDNLKEKDCIKIEFKEDTSEPAYNKKGKKKTRMSVCGIAPNMPNTRKNIGNIMNDRANEVFHKFMNIIADTKIMSEILDIEDTEDTNELLRAFAEKYWDLIFPFSKDEDHQKALNQLREKSLAVVGKYLKNNDEDKQQ